jgi:uncharacterized protein (TIGR00730 family)
MAEEKQYHVVNPPQEHRMEGELRVCDPEKTDNTKDMETWRIFRIMAEFIEGFDLLRRYRLAATIFGSARDGLGGGELYSQATELANRLSKAGFTIITGGAAGIMEAANKGAYEVGGQLVGLNIKLPKEQSVNPYLTEGMTFNYFFSRKVMLSFASEVYIYFPGGFGTMDEFTEILTLSQTNKIKRIPIVLFGKEYWEPITRLFKEHLFEKYHTISEKDLSLYHVVDSVDEAFEYILSSVHCE